MINQNKSELSHNYKRHLTEIAMGTLAVGIAVVIKFGISIYNKGKKTKQGSPAEGWRDLESPPDNS